MSNQPKTRGVAILATKAALVLTLALWGHTAAAQALSYYNLPPCRAVDTRAGYGGIMTASTVRNFTLKGVCGIPATPGDVKSVTFNVTVVSPSDTGYLVLWPVGGTYPGVSYVNFTGGDAAIANGGVAQIATTAPDLSATFGTCCGVGTIHLVIDVTGYFK